MPSVVDAPRVVLADLDRTRLGSLAHTLRARGFSVTETGSVAGAARALRQAPVQALVVSSRLPDGGAQDLIAQLVMRPRPFVIVHGGATPLSNALPSGVDALLPGPLLESQVALLLCQLVPTHRGAELDRIRRGDHGMLLYRDRGVLFDQLAAYFARGLRLGERCVLSCEDERVVQQARGHFAQRGLPVASAERTRSLLFLTHDESYFVAGRFEPVAMLNLLSDFVASALEEGFSGVRGAGEGSWVPDTPEDREAWFWYEGEVNRLFEKGALTGLCLYSLERFGPQQILAALQAHPVVIEGQLVCDNAAYREPRYGNDSLGGAERVLDARLHELRSARRLA